MIFEASIAMASLTRLKGFSPWAPIETFWLGPGKNEVHLFLKFSKNLKNFEIFEIYKIFEILKY